MFVNDLEIAPGSQAELEVQLEIAARLQFISASDYEGIWADVEEIGRMLNGLITSLERQ